MMEMLFTVASLIVCPSSSIKGMEKFQGNMKVTIHLKGIRKKPRYQQCIAAVVFEMFDLKASNICIFSFKSSSSEKDFE